MPHTNNIVQFLSAGNINNRKTFMKIDSWDVDKAIQMLLANQTLRQNMPFAFQFITYEQEDGQAEQRMTAKSGMHYINGVVQSLDELEKSKNFKDKQLASNVKSCGWESIVTTHCPHKVTWPFTANDSVVCVPA